MTRTEARAEHARIATELFHAYRALALEKSAEREAKVNTFLNFEGTDRQRDQMASKNGLDNTKEVWRLEGEIRALEEIRDDIRWQYANGSYEDDE